MSSQSQYFCDYAWLGGAIVERDVLVSTKDDRIAKVDVGGRRPPTATHLKGLTLPGLANSHSHAFHRALRGRAQDGRGTFWTWREEMYRIAEALTPDNYYLLAKATYAEMVLSGITAVGEFHYIHHQKGGGRYADANVMGQALVAAAQEAGVRITLFDTCYLESAPGQPPQGPQARFSDGNAESWAERVTELSRANNEPGVCIGAAVHSVRSVPPQSSAIVAAYARANELPLHFHLSEQSKENEIAASAYGLSPTEILDSVGALGPTSTAIHGTHLSRQDETLLAMSATGLCMCPTTEQDLADGIGPARRLALAGVPISLGSDSHVVIDHFLEMRSLEYGERLASGTRGHWASHELLGAATVAGHRALGWPTAGSIVAGSLADLVTLGLSSPRLAGASDHDLLNLAALSALAADVTHVVNAGEVIVTDGRHVRLNDVSSSLKASVAAVTTA
jgi:formiminoglutamate deiminase